MIPTVRSSLKERKRGKPGPAMKPARACLTGIFRPPNLPGQIREALRSRHYSRRTGDNCLMASLMHGPGLRLMECMRLRVQEIDFSRNKILVRDGKGPRSRSQCCPRRSRSPLKNTCGMSRRSMSATCPTAGVVCPCPTPPTANIPPRPSHGAGNGLFPRKTGGRTRRPVKKDAITSTNRSSRKQSVARCEGPSSQNAPLAILSAIPSPRRSCKTATAFGTCSNFSAMSI